MVDWRNAIRDTCPYTLCTVFCVNMNILSEYRSCFRHSTATAAAVVVAATKRLHLMIMKCNKIPIRIVRLLLPIFSRNVKNHAMRSLQRTERNERKNLQKQKQSNRRRRKKHFTLFLFFFHSAVFNAKVITLWGNSWFFTYSKRRRRKIYAVSFYCSRTVTNVNVLCIQAHIVV